MNYIHHSLLSLFAVFFITNSCNAIITSTNRITDIVYHLESMAHDSIIVLFDIDNTIATTQQELGSDQWFSYQIKKHMSNGLSAQEALEAVLPLYIHIQHLVDLRTVEPDVVALIKQLQQDKKIVVMALTARSYPLMDRTLAQLAQLDIDFAPANTWVGERMLMGSPSAWVYCNGILFCNNHQKGHVLMEFLSATHDAPRAVVFIDDKKHHIEHVHQCTAQAELPCLCIHYTFMDNAVNNFDASAADAQLDLLLSVFPCITN